MCSAEKKGRGLGLSLLQTIDRTHMVRPRRKSKTQQIKRAKKQMDATAAGEHSGRRRSRRWSETARTFLVLDLGLDVADGVAALDLERDRLPRQRLDEDLHLDSPSWDRSLAGGSGWFRGGVVNW